MKKKQSFGHHHSEHRVAQKLQAFIVARTRGAMLAADRDLLAESLLAGRSLVG
jgi:hypothetical protein